MFLGIALIALGFISLFILEESNVFVAFLMFGIGYICAYKEEKKEEFKPKNGLNNKLINGDNPERITYGSKDYRKSSRNREQGEGRGY